MIVVTSGQQYTDIDALACAVAYAELLRFEGKKADAILPGPLNHSVSPTVRSWDFSFSSEGAAEGDQYVIVDVSNPASFARFVKKENIIEIFDHHYGFEEEWQRALGENCHIETIGACATLIWEEINRRGYAFACSKFSARLLLTAIISNTLNFGAHITNERDRKAYGQLQAIADLPLDWTSNYFSEQEQFVLENVSAAIQGDTKIITIPGFEEEVVVGQMELWDSGAFLNAHINTIKETLEDYGCPQWIMSLPSVGEGKTYFYTESRALQSLFGEILKISFKKNLAVASELWLRKEIRKKLIEHYRS